MAPAEAHERVLQLGLGERVVAQVAGEPARSAAAERVRYLRFVEQPLELRLPHCSVEGRVIEGV